MDVRKAGAIIIKDRKLLFTRTKGKDFFVAPGGKLEGKETYEQALIRELKEELDINITPYDFTKFGTYIAHVIEDQSKEIEMEVFVIKSWQGEIKPNGNIEEIQWFGSILPKSIKSGSIFEYEIIPRLKEANLID